MTDGNGRHAKRPRGRAAGGGTATRAPGTEPMTARTATELRKALASVALVVFTAATVVLVVFALRADDGGAPSGAALGGLAAVCGLVALSTAVDLAVLRRRNRRNGGGESAGV
ncbi:hypothetical protein AB0G74_07535 [Streptomyces sp. NPDC020875]|uniref:hypothetical protein n=1 Tax=Streptomyces sp. NPDC020875 TaxID=3154898 RepID=UPI0033DF5580